jgi:sugar phosphate isomerase/epimerase
MEFTLTERRALWYLLALCCALVGRPPAQSLVFNITARQPVFTRATALWSHETMRLGATINSYFTSTDPDEYVAECRKWGYRSANSPAVDLKETEKIRAIAKAFSDADIIIGEVQAWVSALDPRPEVRARNLSRIKECLAIADELNAACCVTVIGTLDTRDDIACDTPHPDNFKQSTYDACIEWVKKVLKAVRPRRSKLALEMSPWTLLDGPEIYREIIEAVDDPALAVHLDPSNAILNTRIFWDTTELIDRCFDLLGRWIVSCHAKDVYYSSVVHLRHVNFTEVIPGQGVLDYRRFLTRANELSPDLPVMMEHLPAAEDYGKGAEYIRSVARQLGVNV